MGLDSWLRKYFHFHTWSKWETTKEFKHKYYYPAFESPPSDSDVSKYGRPVLDQRRSCVECGEVQLRRIYG